MLLMFDDGINDDSIIFIALNIYFGWVSLHLHSRQGEQLTWEWLSWSCLQPSTPCRTSCPKSTTIMDITIWARPRCCSSTSSMAASPSWLPSLFENLAIKNRCSWAHSDTASSKQRDWSLPSGVTCQTSSGGCLWWLEQCFVEQAHQWFGLLRDRTSATWPAKKAEQSCSRCFGVSWCLRKSSEASWLPLCWGWSEMMPTSSYWLS